MSMATKSKYELFLDMLEELDKGVNLIEEYDSQLHDYNGVILYQAESQLIKMIGNMPGISAAECARKLNKTLSACSQLIKKLKKKGWIEQVRNELNNRVYNLYLSEEGKIIFENHSRFEEKCYKRTFTLLKDCTAEDMQAYIRVQKLLNLGFQDDVEEGKALNLQEPLS